MEKQEILIPGEGNAGPSEIIRRGDGKWSVTVRETTALQRIKVLQEDCVARSLFSVFSHIPNLLLPSALLDPDAPPVESPYQAALTGDLPDDGEWFSAGELNGLRSLIKRRLALPELWKATATLCDSLEKLYRLGVMGNAGRDRALLRVRQDGSCDACLTGITNFKIYSHDQLFPRVYCRNGEEDPWITAARLFVGSLALCADTPDLALCAPQNVYSPLEQQLGRIDRVETVWEGDLPNPFSVSELQDDLSGNDPQDDLSDDDPQDDLSGDDPQTNLNPIDELIRFFHEPFNGKSPVDFLDHAKKKLKRAAKLKWRISKPKEIRLYLVLLGSRCNRTHIPAISAVAKSFYFCLNQMTKDVSGGITCLFPWDAVQIQDFPAGVIPSLSVLHSTRSGNRPVLLGALLDCLDRRMEMDIALGVAPLVCHIIMPEIENLNYTLNYMDKMMITKLAKKRVNEVFTELVCSRNLQPLSQNIYSEDWIPPELRSQSEISDPNTLHAVMLEKLKGLLNVPRWLIS